MTKIYFCGSIRGGRDDAEIYARIIKYLQAYGQVLTEHVGATEQHFQEGRFYVWLKVFIDQPKTLKERNNMLIVVKSK